MFRYKELSGDQLKERAQFLNVSLSELYDVHGNLSEPKLQERVRSAEMARLARNSWVIALISAIVSVISTATALVALLQK